MVDERRGQKTMPRSGSLIDVVAAAPVQGVSRPNIGASTRQLAILLLDTSGSMAGNPIIEVSAASRDFVRELANPANRDGFHVAVVAFDAGAKVHVSPKLAGEIRDTELDLQAGMAGGGNTNMRAGLERVLQVVNEPRPGNWAKPVVVLMSDGAPDLGNAPEAAAQRLKTKADLLCVGFGAADHALLARLATSPAHALKAATGPELRAFFAAVGRTMSQAARTGQNTSALLGSSGVLRG